MTQQEFIRQMNRLISVYGVAFYAEERRKLVWNEVGMLPDATVTRIVDSMIGSLRQAPLLPEFREYAAREREKAWLAEKKLRADDAKEFWSGSLMPDETREICQIIKKRLLNQVSDKDWTTFMKGISQL